MRHVFAAPDFRDGFVEMLPACVGLIPFGARLRRRRARARAPTSLGALGMSAIIFSGAAQILAAQMLAAGAPVAVIVLTCAVLGLRFLMYSAAIAPHSEAAAGALAARARVPADRPGVRRGDPAFRSTPTRAAARCISWAAARAVGHVADREHARLLRRQRHPGGVVARVRGAAVLHRAARAALRDAPPIVAAMRRRASRCSRWTHCRCGSTSSCAGLLGIVAGTARGARERAMEGALKLWAVILAVGALNYASRLSFIALFARRDDAAAARPRAALRAGGDADGADRADGRRARARRLDSFNPRSRRRSSPASSHGSRAAR